MDPFPDETTTEHKNNQNLKSLRIIVRAHSKWRTLIQENQRNLSTNSASLQHLSQRTPPFPHSVSAKEAPPQGNGAKSSRPLLSSESGAAASPQEGLVASASHPSSSTLLKPYSTQERLRGVGLSSPTTSSHRAEALPQGRQHGHPRPNSLGGQRFHTGRSKLSPEVPTQ